jgi:hypothetical protein
MLRVYSDTHQPKFQKAIAPYLIFANFYLYSCDSRNRELIRYIQENSKGKKTVSLENGIWISISTDTNSSSMSPLHQSTVL